MLPSGSAGITPKISSLFLERYTGNFFRHIPKAMIFFVSILGIYKICVSNAFLQSVWDYICYHSFFLKYILLAKDLIDIRRIDIIIIVSSDSTFNIGD